MFDHIRKTKARNMRLAVSYRSVGGQVTYVDKNLPEAIAERTRILQSLQDLDRMLRACPHYQHPAARMARFAIRQVTSPDDYLTPEDLAREVGRLNGCLDDLLRCLNRMSGHQISPMTGIRFLAQYRQTARKRDIDSGWNRSKVDKHAPPTKEESHPINEAPLEQPV